MTREVKRTSNPPRARMLGLILLSSLILNVLGLDWGLPYIWNADEKIDQAVLMEFHRTANPNYFVNPSLHIYLVTAAVAVARAVHPEHGVQLFFGRIVPLTEPTHPGRSLQFLAMRLARGLSVLAAVATIWMLYRLGRRQFGENAGLLAATLLAVTMGFVNMAHFATVESVLFLIVVCALVCFDRIVAFGRARDYVIAGTVVGFAVSTKYTAVMLVAPFVTAHVLRQGPRHMFSSPSLLWLGVGGIAAVLAFFAGTPYALLDWNRFWREGVVFNWRTGAPTGSLMGLQRSWGPYTLVLANAMGWPLFVLCVAGVAVGFARIVRAHRSGSSTSAYWIHLVWIGAFYGFYGASPHRALRFILPIVPSLVLLGSVAAMSVIRWSVHTTARLGAVALVAGIVTYSAAYTVAADLMFLRDTRYEAGAWLSAQPLVKAHGVSHFAIEAYLPYFERPAHGIRFLSFVDNLRLRSDQFWGEAAAHMAATEGPIVDADLYYLRFFGDTFFGTAHRLRDRADFYTQLMDGTHPSGYRAVKWFVPRNPWWLNPAPEKVSPKVVVFEKTG